MNIRLTIRDPLALTLLVAATRIPFFARTLYEVDSVNYAIALFRFDVAQDTPHLPGYLLHVGIGKLLYAIVGDVNLAYVAESFLLSIGSVLCVWWGLRAWCVPRTALAAAIAWALNPTFWMYGCIATVYPHEAFFTALVASLCMRYLRGVTTERDRLRFPVGIALSIALAGAARESSLVFLAPGAVLTMWVVRPPLRAWLAALGVGAAVTAVWVTILLVLVGGYERYRELAANVTVVQAYSVLLNGTWSRHVDMLGRLALHFLIGAAPLWTLLLVASFTRRRALIAVLRRAISAPVAWVLVSFAAVPLTFYMLVYYAKPGYLLGVFAISMMGSALLIERLSANSGRTPVRWAAGWAVIGIVYFLLPLPGKSITDMHRQVAQGSSTWEVSNRFPSLASKIAAAGSKLFLFASSDGIAAVDQENQAMLVALDAVPSREDQQVVIATRWGEPAVFYRPQSIVYDMTIAKDFTYPVIEGQNFVKRIIRDTVVALPRQTRDVVLQIWEHHWAMPDIRRQVHLEPLSMPPYLDVYRVTDEHFRLALGGVVFVK